MVEFANMFGKSKIRKRQAIERLAEADEILKERILAAAKIDRLQLAQAIQRARDIHAEWESVAFLHDPTKLVGINKSFDHLDIAIQKLIAVWFAPANQRVHDDAVFAGLATSLSEGGGTMNGIDEAIGWLRDLPQNLQALRAAMKSQRRAPKAPTAPEFLYPLISSLATSWTEMTGQKFTQGWAIEDKGKVGPDGKPLLKRDAGLRTPTNAATTFAFRIVELIDSVAAEQMRNVMRQVIADRQSSALKSREE